MGRRANYHAGLAYQARRAFVFQGKAFKMGEAFPGKGVEVDPRRLRQMYESGKLQYQTGA